MISNDTEDAGRARVVAEARGWIGCPYHHAAAIRGAGVDCARILIEVYADAGLIDRFTPEPYPHDWHLHRDAERYLDQVLVYAREIAPAQIKPGDIVVWQNGRTFSHGAIVTDWPRVVHAYAPAGIVEEVDVTGSAMMRRGAGERPMRAFSFWG